MKILITGYYGFANEGDELLLETLLKQLQSPKHEFRVLSNAPLETEKRHCIPAFSRWKLITVFKEIHYCDVFMFGGGGLIQDLSGFLTPLYYLLQLILAQWLGKKIILAGQGFGPVNSKINQWLSKCILPKVDMICCRDETGFSWCRQMGVSEKRLFLAADLVWLKTVHYRLVEKKHWIVCLRSDWLDHKVPDWIGSVIALAKSQNRQVQFVAIGNQGDQELLNKLKEQSKCEICCLAENEKAVEEKFRSAELVISMRYHALLLGARLGAVLIGLGKDDKLNQLLRALGQPLMSDESIVDQVVKVLDKKESWLYEMNVRKDKLILRAQQGIEKIKTYLNASRI